MIEKLTLKLNPWRSNKNSRVFLVRISSKGQVNIRDEKDLPILVSAIIGDVDMFITGDKDFHCVDIEKPQIVFTKDFSEM